MEPSKVAIGGPMLYAGPGAAPPSVEPFTGGPNTDVPPGLPSVAAGAGAGDIAPGCPYVAGGAHVLELGPTPGVEYGTPDGGLASAAPGLVDGSCEENWIR
jgi:hypothetical protein